MRRLRPVLDAVYDPETDEPIPGAFKPRTRRVEKQVIDIPAQTITDDQFYMGVIAQDVIQAFATVKLDAQAYGLVTGSEEDGYGVRYEGLWALQLQADEYRDQQLEDVTQRLATLETRLSR